MNSARAAFALLTIAVWFGLSNHCALGLALPSQESVAPDESNGCPMHSAPVKKKPALKTPCCKEVRAVLTKFVTAATPAYRLFRSPEYAPEVFPPVRRIAIEIDGLDTGPPGCVSFAELVLQESTFAHAPPIS